MKGDYSNGRIYKIEPICEHDENEVYYGSTCQLLCKRMDSHRSGYKSWKNGKHDKTSSYELFENYGVENCKIYLVELYPCDTKEQLLAREGDYIKNNKCVNKKLAGRTTQIYYENHRVTINERQKKYALENKDKIKEYKKDYRQNKKEFIAEREKVYRDNNKDKLIEKSKIYYQNNKEKLKTRLYEKFYCSCCSAYFSKNNKSNHLKSKCHLENSKIHKVEEVNDV